MHEVEEVEHQSLKRQLVNLLVKYQLSLAHTNSYLIRKIDILNKIGLKAYPVNKKTSGILHMLQSLDNHENKYHPE